uniref:Actin maturation protease n=1 Tax=Phlebotomus papatasi TaxID=29031 RepID=A0A1B0DQI3_PHLPP
MSHKIIPIPPPAPDFAAVNRLIYGESSSHSALNNSLDFRECLWAAEYPEVQKSCFLARVCEQKPPKRCVFYQMEPILQQGPTCGFVTISMLLNGASTADQLFQKAKAKGFTAMGEMFSAANLLDILQSQEGFSGKCQLFEGHLNCDEIRETLKSDACLIVPYDSDVNHSPCLKKGHKAHWALVFYVIARQGKSRLLGIWLLSDLAESNANLTEFSQPKQYPEADFILPEGGIAGPRGLCRRSIVIQGGTFAEQFRF